MQVTETLNEGLKRQLKVVVGADELEEQMTSKLQELKSEVRIKGFRPGKVPVNHLRRLYGRSVMAEVVQKTVDETTQKAIAEREEKPAYQPEISLTEDPGEIEQLMEGKADLAYTVTFEIIPDFEVADLTGITLEKSVAKVAEEEVQESLKRLADQYREYEPRGEGDGACEGDRVTIDFIGRIDGETFEGGSAQDVPLEIGSDRFIPGFEKQLVGAKTGDQLTVEVTFPEDYGVEHLAGKPAAFEVNVKDISVPKEATVDDALAQRLGMEDLETLKARIRDQIEAEFEQVSNAKLKRQLLDRLDELHSFALPDKLVEGEFNQIWQTLEREMEREGQTFEDEGKTEEELRAEYRKIAERRVRLGLVLGRVGEAAGVTITEQEMQAALMERARQFQGQEREVFEYYRQNPQAMLELRGPLFEQKVVDHIVAQAAVTDKEVSREELLADPDEEGHDHDHDHAGHDHDHSKDAAKTKKAAPKKKTSPKKKPAGSDDGETADAGDG